MLTNAGLLIMTGQNDESALQLNVTKIWTELDIKTGHEYLPRQLLLIYHQNMVKA